MAEQGRESGTGGGVGGGGCGKAAGDSRELEEKAVPAIKRA